MRAFYKSLGKPVCFVDIPKPEPDENEALIRILRAGICATDIEMNKGYGQNFQGVLGHEFVGIVEEVNSKNFDTNKWVDKRVVGEINVSCQKCPTCLDSKNVVIKRNHCPNRQCLGICEKNGSFSEYITLPIDNLHELPTNISDEEGCFVEPLAAACRIVEQKIIEKSDKIAIIGDGKLGLLIAEVVMRQDLDEKVTVIGKHQKKLELLGCNIIPEILSPSIAKKFENNFNVTIVSSASLSGLQLASSLTKPLGKIILKSTCSEREIISLNSIVVKELHVIGSRCGPFESAINLLQSGNISLEKYVSTIFPFDEMDEAFEYAAKKGVLKVQVVM